MIGSEINLVSIAVSQSIVKQTVNQFCVYLAEMRWYAVGLSWLVKQCYTWHFIGLKIVDKLDSIDNMT